jgi:hypothetical protein
MEKSDSRAAADSAVVRLRPMKEEDAAAPITDRKGNINLFPELRPDVPKKSRQSEQSREKERRKAEEEDHGMHLKAAWGRKDPNRTWYLDKDGAVKDAEGKDVWGNEDAHRQERQAKRINSSDPLAFMKKAQRQLKEVQRDRKERDAELEDLRSRNSREKDELEGFSLDDDRSSREPRRRHRSEGGRKHREKASHRRRTSRENRRREEQTRKHDHWR